jgi:hypothetical protein
VDPINGSGVSTIHSYRFYRNRHAEITADSTPAIYILLRLLFTAPVNANAQIGRDLRITR